MALSPGTHLGPYTVVEHVGAGGTAEVYRGRDEQLGRVVALKLLAGTSERARREAAAMTALSHPHIVATFDVIEHTGRLCLIQEWIDGGSVQAELDSVGRLGLTETVRMGEAVASALSYAHRHGILHRDIKPSNVLRTAEGVYKLVDFGAVGRLRAETSATAAGEIAGTPLYMSVEQITGAPQTPASDLFGLGLLLFRCLHGYLPDENADTYIQLLQSRLQTPISVPPSPLRGLLARCLALDPTQRPRSADEVLAELRQIAPAASPADAGVVSPGSPPPRRYGLALPEMTFESPSSGGKRRYRRRTLHLVLVVLAALVLSASVVWVTLPADQGPAAPPPRVPPAIVENSFNWSTLVGLVIVAAAFVVAQHIRRRWAGRAPEAEHRAAAVLFGAGQREELTRSLTIEVDQVVRNLNSLDAKFLGMTVMAMIREYEEARNSSERQAALLNVVALMERLQARFSPWHVRHKEAIATAVAVVGSLVGVVSVISGFLK